MKISELVGLVDKYYYCSTELKKQIVMKENGIKHYNSKKEKEFEIQKAMCEKELKNYSDFFNINLYDLMEYMNASLKPYGLNCYVKEISHSDYTINYFEGDEERTTFICDVVLYDIKSKKELATLFDIQLESAYKESYIDDSLLKATPISGVGLFEKFRDNKNLNKVPEIALWQALKDNYISKKTKSIEENKEQRNSLKRKMEELDNKIKKDEETVSNKNYDFEL